VRDRPLAAVRSDRLGVRPRLPLSLATRTVPGRARQLAPGVVRACGAEHVPRSNSTWARQRGAGKGIRVRDAITGRFLKDGTEKRRPRAPWSSGSSAAAVARSSRPPPCGGNPSLELGGVEQRAGERAFRMPIVDGSTMCLSARAGCPRTASSRSLGAEPGGDEGQRVEAGLCRGSTGAWGVAVTGVPSLAGPDEVTSHLRSCRGLDSGLVCAIRAPDQARRACAV
jgi:hypothetical protein